MDKSKSPSSKKSKIESPEHKNGKSDSESLSENSSHQTTEIRKSKAAAKVRKKAHAKSIYNLRSEQNLNGKRFRHSPAIESDDEGSGTLLLHIPTLASQSNASSRIRR